MNKTNASLAKIKIMAFDDTPTSVPTIIPDLDAVRAFAYALHVQGKAWQGEAFGWEAAYKPERPEPPPYSKMTFTPAEFWIGDSSAWFFSMMWEYGSDSDPVEFLDDRNVQYKLSEYVGGERSEDVVMDVKDMAAYLKISRRSVYNLASAGEMPAIKIAGQWRFYRPAIVRWLEEETHSQR